MNYLSFIYPEALLLLLLLLPLWGVALAVPRRFSRLRFWGSLALRTLILVALILSLAGTQLVFPVDTLTTIYLVDSSDSVSPSARGRAESFVRAGIERMQEDDQAGIVVFGQNALVERAPTSNTWFGHLSSLPIAAHTDIERALQLGMALFPAETQKRIVLLSDGGENSGYALDAARLAAAHNIPIDVVDLSGIVTSEEAAITAIDAPTHARDGQELEVVITVESTIAQAATLVLFEEQDIVMERQVELAAGDNRFRVKVMAEGAGFQRYRARLEPQRDGRVQNNEAATLVQVQSEPRILLVEGQQDDARNLHDALHAASIVAETTAPEHMPRNLAELSNYEAVVLVNVAARHLPIEVIAALPTYVRDLGKGLMMVGGTESYGVGGYGRTPMEETLPVYMDVRDREIRPNLAIVFVIDKSGSMDACHCDDPDDQPGRMEFEGDRKVDIAKEAAVQASTLLTERDMMGVVGFDRAASDIMPVTQGPDPLDVAEAVAPMEPHGDTNVGLGLLAAEEMLAAADARIKHVVLLTDGWGEGGSNTPLAQRMKDNGITLSVVAAGSGSADDLQELAHAGGGRYYPAQHMRDVPQIFLQETIIASGHYIVEGAFVPTVTSDVSLVQAATEYQAPLLYGYNGTTIKESARLLMAADHKAPLLAEWQYGLGRSIAWTSDMKGKWARDWVQWEHFPAFAAGLVNRVIPTRSANGIAASIETEGTRTILNATLHDERGEPHSQAQVRAILLNSDTDAPQSQGSDQQTEVSLTQVAPGEYRAALESPPPGTYLVQFIGRENDRIVAQNVVGLVVPYSPEYRQHQDNPALLDNLMQLTSGTRLTSPEQDVDHNLTSVRQAQEIALPLLLLALLLLPLDIATRRFMLHRRELADLRTRLHLPAIQRRKRGQSATGSQQAVASTAQKHHAPPGTEQQEEPPDPMQRLQQARQRARQRMRGE
jgi:Mg-chelatase subunit ChlD